MGDDVHENDVFVTPRLGKLVWGKRPTTEKHNYTINKGTIFFDVLFSATSENRRETYDPQGQYFTVRVGYYLAGFEKKSLAIFKPIFNIFTPTGDFFDGRLNSEQYSQLAKRIKVSEKIQIPVPPVECRTFVKEVPINSRPFGMCVAITKFWCLVGE
jgi:hypothetical protein